MTSITTLSTSILPDIEETQFRIEGLVTPNIVDLSTTKPSITVETTEGKIEIDNPAQLLEFITLNQSAEIVSINYSVELNGPHTVNVDTITNVLRTEVQEISVEVLGYGGSGGGVLVDYDSVFAWGGADQANAVVNSRFFSSLYGWEFSGVANRILRTDLTVPADAPSQYVARFGGQYARYTSRKLDVIPNENVFVGVMLATNALSAPDIMVKVVRYAADDTLIGESLIDTIAQTSTWHRVAESYDVPADGTARLEFLLEITGAGPAYDANKRWYFTNAALYSTASDLLVNARIDAEITTRASADSALASSLSTVSTTVGGHTTSISALTSSVNGLNAQWGVSINVDGVITGAVRLDTVNSFSTFAVRADKFVVTNSNNTEGGAPFELVGGVAFIKQAVIPDLTTRNLLVKNSGNIKVIDSQITPVTRVEIGSIGADYGLIVRNAAGAVIFNVDSLGANTVGTSQILNDAVIPSKTSIAAISNLTGNLNPDTVDTAQIIDGAISSAALFSSSIRPIEVVGSLPVTGNFDGRMVFLTTDKKLYRYNAVAAAYTASVATADLSGTIIETQIANDAITTPKIAANAVTAAQIAANTITAAQIAANTITAGQIAAATITGDRVAANTITASRLLITSGINLVTDADLRDTSYWTNVNATGIAINSVDTVITSNMGARAGIKSSSGNGTLSQSDDAMTTGSFLVEPGKYYRLSSKVAVSAGFTGIIAVFILWRKKDGTNASTAGSVLVAADHRTSAAGSLTIYNLDGQHQAPSDAYFGIYQAYVSWSTTINNAGNGYFTYPQINRANSGELIVDGTITAAKIAAATIVASNIAANAITASKLTLSDTTNIILDPFLSDAAYWNTAGGTIDSSDAALVTMGVPRAWKTPVGNGTLSQPNNYAQASAATPFAVEPGKYYRYYYKYFVKAGFTGYLQPIINWYDKNGSLITNTQAVTVDYRTSAAPADVNAEASYLFLAPATSALAHMYMGYGWSTTINNAQYALASNFRLSRAVNAELIVDGTITAAKIAANTITASQIAANTITAGQIAAGTITGDKIAANTITAGKLILSDVTSYITDPLFLDSSYWSLSGGTIETSDAALATMNVPKAWKSPVGNGTLSQSTVFLTTAVAPSYPYVCEPGRGYRVSFKYFIKTGFTGLLQPAITWFDRNGTIIITDAPTTGDWRTTPAGSDINSEYSTIFTAPANAAYMTFYMLITWSTTVNNAQYVLISQWRVIRATNAELIVDGTITAAKIAANTITASQIAASTITATQMAANSITASKLSIGEPSLLLDSNFDDQTYWLLGAGASGYDTSTETTTTLGLPRSVKSVLGNGTTSQAANGLVQLRNSNYYIPVEGGRPIRLSAKAFYKAGFTGTLRVIVNWYKQDKTTLASVSNSQLAGTNYTTVAAASDTIEEINGIVTAPADACFALYYIYQYWSTTLNNAQYCLVGRPRANKAINAELIVDGTITAAKITAGTITSAQIATDAIKSSDWNATTKQGWLLGTNGSIQASSIEIWSPGVSPKKIFGASGMSYNGSSFYGLDQIITKINKAAEDGSPGSLVFDGTNPDTWVDLCDIAITATGGHDIDVECLTDLLIEQLYDSAYAFDLSKIAGAPDFQLRVRRTQGSTVDIYTSPWYKLSTVGQLPAQIFRVRDTTAVAGAATYLLQAKWRKGTYSAGTISKGAFDTFVTGTGVSWLANIGADNSPLSTWYQATGAITFSGQPSAGNTITFNSIVITFVAGSPGANQVQIGANLNTTITNLANALNLHGDSHISVATYANVGGTQLSITHDAPGTVGNAYTLAKSGANITISGSVLTGGSDGYAAWEIQVSSVDPNWFPIIQLNNRAKLTLHPSGYVPLIAPSLSGASYAVRANYHAVMMRLVNYTIRTTEFRNTAVT